MFYDIPSDSSIYLDIFFIFKYILQGWPCTNLIVVVTLDLYYTPGYYLIKNRVGNVCCEDYVYF